MALIRRWAVGQDRRGVMYFANNDAILDLDYRRNLRHCHALKHSIGRHLIGKRTELFAFMDFFANVRDGRLFRQAKQVPFPASVAKSMILLQK
jgi:hypothetical protein